MRWDAGYHHDGGADHYHRRADDHDHDCRTAVRSDRLPRRGQLRVDR